MKEKELRGHAECSICKRKILHTGVPLFWVLRIERYGVDLNAMRRQQGLGMMLGAQLAMVMGPDADMAKQIGDTAALTVCEDCGSNPASSLPCVAALAEISSGT